MTWVDVFVASSRTMRGLPWMMSSWRVRSFLTAELPRGEDGVAIIIRVLS